MSGTRRHTRPEDRFTKVYRNLRDRPGFADVYPNLRLTGAWLHLHLAADEAYPLTGALPPAVSRRTARVLADAGLIVLEGGGRFRDPAVDQERQRQAAAKRLGAEARWDPQDPPEPDAYALHPEQDAGEKEKEKEKEKSTDLLGAKEHARGRSEQHEPDDERGAFAPSLTEKVSVRQETRSHGLRSLSEILPDLGGPIQ